jgi:hypothetical protein
MDLVYNSKCPTSYNWDEFLVHLMKDSGILKALLMNRFWN